MLDIEKLEIDLIAYLRDEIDSIPDGAALMLHTCQCAIRQLDERLAAERGQRLKLQELLDVELAKTSRRKGAPAGKVATEDKS